MGAFHSAEAVWVRPSCRLCSVHKGPSADLDREGALDAALVRVALAGEVRLHVDDVDISVDGDASVNDDLACVGERALNAWADTFPLLQDREASCVGAVDACQAAAEMREGEFPYLHLDDILATAYPVVHDHYCHCWAAISFLFRRVHLSEASADLHSAT